MYQKLKRCSMSRFVMSLVVVLSLSVSAKAQTCVDLFGGEIQAQPAVVDAKTTPTRDLEEVKKLAQEFAEAVSTLEQKIRFWSDLTGKYERGFLFDLRERRQLFDFYLRETGEVYRAVSIYAQIFKNVELSYFKLQEYYASANPSVAAHPEVVRLFKIFGENYSDYMYVRTYLEKQANMRVTRDDKDGQALKKNAQDVLRRLGLPYLTDRFPELRVLLSRPDQQQRPTINEIQEMWRTHTEPLLYKLKRDLAEERKLALRSFVSSALQLQRVRDIINRGIPLSLREPITNFLGLNYNSYVLKKYLPDLELIVSARGQGRLNTFIEIFAKYDQTANGLEFLTTYVRITSKNESWMELRTKIKELLAATPSNVLFKKLDAQMAKAEETAEKMSFVSEMHKPSMIDQFTFWIAPLGLGTAAYFYGDFQAVKEVAQNFWNYLF